LHLTAQPGHLVLERRSVFYVLDEFRRRVRPLASRRVADHFVGPQDERIVDVPVPRSRGKPMEGYWRYATSSPRYGWTIEGKAVVFLPEGLCGIGSDPPGVYLFRRAGEGHLLVLTGRDAAARMWGTTVAG
jgi:hypothetical protein